jgi:hypothetical protein
VEPLVGGGFNPLGPLWNSCRRGVGGMLHACREMLVGENSKSGGMEFVAQRELFNILSTKHEQLILDRL